MSNDFERGAHDRPALSRLITQTSDQFAADTWGRRPLLSRSGELPGPFDDLFSLEAVDELVSSRAIRTPFVRMANEGELLPPVSYTSSGGFGAEIGDQLDSEKVLREFAAGATLVLQGLHRTWRPISDFTRQLVTDIGHPAQVNAYVTPASSRGFDAHYDVHDVFVIQIAGEKHWVIHEPVHTDPLRDQPWSDHRADVAARATGTPAMEATFQPGDVLYLPRGWIHSATALGGTSVHLTIGVSALTRWDVVQQLISALASDPSLRASLPMSVDLHDVAALDPIVRETVDALTTAVTATIDAHSIGERLARGLEGSSRAEPVAPMATIEALSSLGADSQVRWRSGLAARLDRRGDSLDIVLSTRTLTLPAEAVAAMNQLKTGETVRVGSLAGLDLDSALVVARRLVREGVLVIE